MIVIMTVNRIARLRIQLDDIMPVVWRRVEVPVSMSLKALHNVIQAVMSFENYHLFEFDVGGRIYDIPDPEEIYDRKTYAAQNARIETVIDRGYTTFSYIYDFGDNWRHTIAIEAVEKGDLSQEYPRFIDGERRAPPEDIGGTAGFEEFLEAMRKPRHSRHEEMVRWYGERFDPADISTQAVMNRLHMMARRRAAGKAAFSKSQSPLKKPPGMA